MSGTPTRHAASASVALAAPARSMNRLAKHFSHRLPVSRAEDHARIDFPEGICMLAATATTLRIDIECGAAATLERYQEVVARHLVQVTPDEAVDVRWQGPTTTATALGRIRPGPGADQPPATSAGYQATVSVAVRAV